MPPPNNDDDTSNPARGPAPAILAQTTLATLVDLPRSLSAPPGLTARSTAPLTRPFASPKTPPPPPATEQDEQLIPRIEAALQSLKAEDVASWCHPRYTAPPPEGEVDFRGGGALLATTTATASFGEGEGEEWGEEELQLDPAGTVFDDLSDIYSLPISNASNHWIPLTLRFPLPQKRFFIPPHSSFLLGPLLFSSRRFATVLGKRDFLLLDPPWPNASAKRKRGYRTANRFEIWRLLEGLDVRGVLAEEGVVAVWCTNKKEVREGVRRVFEKWGVREEAQWWWVKVTREGEPVVRLEGGVGGKRCWEGLVFGRRVEEVAVAVEGVEKVETRIEDRILVGVPDIHSRKPGIKDLVEPYLPRDYRAAEIFGRGLTEGWFTWGDECLKWNWEGWWVGDGDGEAQMEGEGGDRAHC